MNFWVSAAIAAWSAAVPFSVVAMTSPSDVERVGLEAAEHTAVQFGVGVRVHQRVEADRGDVAGDPLDRDALIDRRTAGGRGQDVDGLLGQADHRAEVGPGDRALLQLPEAAL